MLKRALLISFRSSLLVATTIGSLRKLGSGGLQRKLVVGPRVLFRRPDAVLKTSLACAALTGILFSGGCVMAPVRLPTETKDISGQKLNLDLGFLKAGSSTREEVGKNLAAIDTQVNQPHFFWGRWETSSWAVAGLVAQMGPAAAPYGERFWGGHNLLIEFDPQGIVKSWRVVDDKKLFPELDRLGAAPSDPVFPVNAKVHVPFSREDPMDHKPASATAELVLAADSLECRSPQISRERMRTFSCQSLRTPRTNISKIEPAHLEESDSSVWVTVHFAKSVRDGHGWKNSYLYIGVDPPTLLLLRRYVHDTKLAAGK